MKKLLVTDKGIGIAEMPEHHPWFEYHSEAWYKHYCETHNYVSPELEWEVDIGNYENAVKQAIASAPLFEDQERVEEILGEQCREFKKDNSSYGASIHLKHGTYPIPPDFPEYVEVRQWYAKIWKKWQDWDNDVTEQPNVEYRTILRFVDEKQESEEELWQDAQIVIAKSLGTYINDLTIKQSKWVVEDLKNAGFIIAKRK